MSLLKQHMHLLIFYLYFNIYYAIVQCNQLAFLATKPNNVQQEEKIIHRSVSINNYLKILLV
jgi:hypothetical protein